MTSISISVCSFPNHCSRSLDSNQLDGTILPQLGNLTELYSLYAQNRNFLFTNILIILSVLIRSLSQGALRESAHWHHPTSSRQSHKAHLFVRPELYYFCLFIINRPWSSIRSHSFVVARSGTSPKICSLAPSHHSSATLPCWMTCAFNITAFSPALTLCRYRTSCQEFVHIPSLSLSQGALLESAQWHYPSSARQPLKTHLLVRSELHIFLWHYLLSLISPLFDMIFSSKSCSKVWYFVWWPFPWLGFPSSRARGLMIPSTSIASYYILIGFTPCLALVSFDCSIRRLDNNLLFGSACIPSSTKVDPYYWDVVFAFQWRSVIRTNFLLYTVAYLREWFATG